MARDIRRQQIEHKEYITRFGDDMPAISGWRWGLKGQAGPGTTSTEGDNL
jgi:xylulose-5-phosphate/fructose-6-phosphate phosphoketolase